MKKLFVGILTLFVILSLNGQVFAKKSKDVLPIAQHMVKAWCDSLRFGVVDRHISIKDIDQVARDLSPLISKNVLDYNTCRRVFKNREFNFKEALDSTDYLLQAVPELGCVLDDISKKYKDYPGLKIWREPGSACMIGQQSGIVEDLKFSNKIRDKILKRLAKTHKLSLRETVYSHLNPQDRKRLQRSMAISDAINHQNKSRTKTFPKKGKNSDMAGNIYTAALISADVSTPLVGCEAFANQIPFTMFGDNGNPLTHGEKITLCTKVSAGMSIYTQLYGRNYMKHKLRQGLDPRKLNAREKYEIREWCKQSFNPYNVVMRVLNIRSKEQCLQRVR